MAHNQSPHVNIDEHEIRLLRQRLEQEIRWLSSQMDGLQGSDVNPDISLLQTYREMIFSRRALLGRIPR
ncbi:hypothetical protein ACNKU7_00460 [Microbulbifer sp. SA54]|uniref:hypothetical protein n=1 Tax=Microbulbifer sp. SA54 TaxID=3401577 RepID=UPI003AB0EC92